MLDSMYRKLLFSISLLSISPLALAQDSLIRRVFGPDDFQFVLVLTFVFIVVFVPLYFAAKRERHRHALYVQFLEKGQEIPPELLPRSATRASAREREMIRGIWLISLGLGLGIVLYIATTNWRIAAWSLILLFLGAASFVNALLLSPPDKSARPEGDAD